MRTTLSPCLVAALVLTLGARPVAGQETPAFRAGAELVVQTVTVTDAIGQPVIGLTVDDFRILEDGVPQDVAFVEFQQFDSATVQAPRITPGATVDRAVPSATATQISRGAVGTVQYQNRRLLVLYFDLTAMGPADAGRALGAAQRFFDTQMEPADLVAVMTFQGGAVRVWQDFTDDRARLQEVILRITFNDDLDGDGIPDNPDTGTAFGQGDREFNVFNTDRQLSALQTAVSMLEPLPEQKALVFFTGGLRLNGTDNQAQLRATTNAAIRANVAIYPIDARGLVADAPLGDATRQSPGGLGAFTGALAEAAITRQQRSQDILFALAGDTGGTALFDFNDLTLGITEAARRLTSYYIVGYYATNTARDGRYRRVDVSLADDRPAELMYRPGYYADKEFSAFTDVDRERQLEEALMLDNPITEITIAMELNYFQLNRAEYFVPVALKMPGSELELAQRRGAARAEIDVIGEVKDSLGNTIQNVRDRIEVSLTSEVASDFAARPIQYETGFTLLPDDYVIKVLVRDAITGRIGTYETSFTVPNLNREDTRVPMSTVVLSAQRVPIGEELFSVRNDDATTVNPLIYGGLRLVPSVTRVFSATRDLYVYLQAYQRPGTPKRPFVAFVSLFRDGAMAMETRLIAVTDGSDPAATRAVPIRISVPLEGLSAGAYLCQVTVLDPVEGKVAFWRAPIVLVP